MTVRKSVYMNTTSDLWDTNHFTAYPEERSTGVRPKEGSHMQGGEVVMNKTLKFQDFAASIMTPGRVSVAMDAGAHTAATVRRWGDIKVLHRCVAVGALCAVCGQMGVIDVGGPFPCIRTIFFLAPAIKMCPVPLP